MKVTFAPSALPLQASMASCGGPRLPPGGGGGWSLFCAETASAAPASMASSTPWWWKNLMVAISYFFRIFSTGAGRRRNASGMPEPSSGRRYMRKASVTPVPLALMNSSSMTRVLPATSDSAISS